MTIKSFFRRADVRALLVVAVVTTIGVTFQHNSLKGDVSGSEHVEGSYNATDETTRSVLQPLHAVYPCLFTFTDPVLINRKNPESGYKSGYSIYFFPQDYRAGGEAIVATGTKKQKEEFGTSKEDIIAAVQIAVNNNAKRMAREKGYDLAGRQCTFSTTTAFHDLALTYKSRINDFAYNIHTVSITNKATMSMPRVTFSLMYPDIIVPLEISTSAGNAFCQRHQDGSSYVNECTLESPLMPGESRDIRIKTTTTCANLAPNNKETGYRISLKNDNVDADLDRTNDAPVSIKFRRISEYYCLKTPQ